MSRMSRRRRRARRSWCPKDSPIKTVADLKGKKVALNKGSNVHYLLVKALEKAGVKYTEIEPVLPRAGRRARGLRERRGRCLGDLGSLPGRGRSRRPARARSPTAPESSPTISSISRRKSFAETHPQGDRRGRRRARRRSMSGSSGNPGAVAEELSPAIGIPAPVLESRAQASGLWHQAARRGGRSPSSRRSRTRSSRSACIPKPIKVGDVVWRAGS